MFDKEIDGADYLFCMLSISKIVYDNMGVLVENNTVFDTDYFWEIYYGAQEMAGEEVAESYDEDNDNYITKYCFPYMREYYTLCREYGRKCQIAFRNNRYIRKSYEFVESQMSGIGSYCIDWKLFVPKKNVGSKYACLLVVQDSEFFQPLELIEALFNIRAFFADGVQKLKKELGITESKIISLPQINAAEERKKTA